MKDSDAESRSGGGVRTPRVVYLRDDAVALCDFSLHVPQHAMKPFRTLVTHALVDALGLSPHMLVVTPPLLSISQLRGVHSSAYLEGLTKSSERTWDRVPLSVDDLEELGVPFTPDCPLVEGIMDYSRSVASGSLFGARLLRSAEADIAIHWAGGMHHARPSECSGFCFINDINLAIVDLLQSFDRVLYVDIDVHHGDGVEEFFYFSNRVFTLSFHRFGESFFPGTGHISDVGAGDGRYYALNVPLPDGVPDTEYVDLFRFTLNRVVGQFSPNVVVLQCGADSLAGDRVGVFNLSSVGHGTCVDAVRRLGLPMLVLGGGGYTIRNVAKLWAYETSILCGLPLHPSTSILGDESEDHLPAPVSLAGGHDRPAKRRRSEAVSRPKLDPFRRLELLLLPCRCPPPTTNADGEWPEEMLQAVADGVMEPLRTFFFPNDVLYVAPEESMVPRCNMSAVMVKLRRVILEHSKHVGSTGQRKHTGEGAN